MAVGTRLEKFGEYAHRDTLLAEYGIKIGDEKYLVMMPLTPTTPTITSVATAGAGWTLLATGLTNVVRWKISELDGNDIHYAFVAAPGDNFSVAFGWWQDSSSPTSIYVKRAASNDITVKLELWRV